MRVKLLPLMVAGAWLATPAMADETAALARSPSDMSNVEIDAHNRDLAFTDAAYIKCRRIPEIGSLVKKARVCRTNAEWKRVADKGNQDARDSMETLARGWSNSREPADQIMPATRPQ